MCIRSRLILLAAALFLTACVQGPAERRSSGGGGVYTNTELPGSAFNDAWVRQGVTDRQRAEDIEDCYYSSRALIAHDQAIERDRYIGRDDSIGADTRAFQKSLNRWEEQNRQVDLFNDCMTSRGYVPATAEGQ